MKLPGIFLGIAVIVLSASVLSAADARKEADTLLAHVIGKLNREARVDGPALLAELIQKQYGPGADEMKWAVAQSVSWGEIVALSYIRSATGRSFETIARGDARKSFLEYLENADMDSEKMVRSLEGFLKSAEKERNSRIFENLRASRRVQAMPDLGSGFGLFQEALDFRRIDSPRPTKDHTVTSGKAKGEQ